MTDTEQETTRGRGRPRVVDPGAVTEAALRLWSTRGYRETGWREIAEVTGISTRTLMRHYRHRADIAWFGVSGATDRLAAALATTPARLPLADALRAAVLESMSHDDVVRGLSAEWAHLVTEEPELASRAPQAYRPWLDVLAGFIADRVPGAPPAVPGAIAAAYQAASHVALLTWAAGDGAADPATAVDDALRWLDVHTPDRTGAGETTPPARKDRS